MPYALKIPNVDFSDVAVEQITYIESIPCTAITLNTSTLSFDSAEESQTLTASLTPANTTDVLEWSSSNENVATVSDGVVTIHGIGTATITATCGSVSATASINQTSIKMAGTLGYVPENYVITRNTNYNTIVIQHVSSYSDKGNVARVSTRQQKYYMDSNLVELIPVPYGATVVKAALSGQEALTASYLYKADTTELINISGVLYPSNGTQQTFANLVTGGAVEYGQGIAFRFGSNSNYTDGCIDYIYFE